MGVVQGIQKCCSCRQIWHLDKSVIYVAAIKIWEFSLTFQGPFNRAHEYISQKGSRNLIKEELNQKFKQSSALKREINSIYDEIRQNCSFLRYSCILHTMTSLRTTYHQEVTTTHTRKISRLINYQMDLDEHILNISSYQLSFFPETCSLSWFELCLTATCISNRGKSILRESLLEP